MRKFYPYTSNILKIYRAISSITRSFLYTHIESKVMLLFPTTTSISVCLTVSPNTTSASPTFYKILTSQAITAKGAGTLTRSWASAHVEDSQNDCRCYNSELFPLKVEQNVEMLKYTKKLQELRQRRDQGSAESVGRQRPVHP